MPVPASSIAELLRLGVSRLALTSDTPQLDAELLLAHTLGVARAHVLSHGEEIPAADKTTSFLALLERRAGGEPLAYIVGAREFWTITLEVNPAVLVPRPETELVVELALAAGDAIGGAVGDTIGHEAARVIDLGTGSGAIALAI